MSPRKPNTPKECRLEDQGFRLWLDAGDARSFRKVAQRMGLRTSDVINHARKFGWKARLETTRARASELTEEAVAQDLAQVNERHLGILNEAAELAINTLRATTDLRPNEAIRLLELTIKLERQIRGADGKEEDLRAVLLEQLRELSGGGTKKLTLKDKRPAIQAPPQITAEPAAPGTPADFEFELDPDLMADADEVTEDPDGPEE